MQIVLDNAVRSSTATLILTDNSVCTMRASRMRIRRSVRQLCGDTHSPYPCNYEPSFLNLSIRKLRGPVLYLRIWLPRRHEVSLWVLCFLCSGASGHGWGTV